MRFSHVSLTARDANALSQFYQQAFGFTEKRAAKRLFGDAVSRGNGLPNSDFLSIWLTIGHDSDPFLELLEYRDTVHRELPRVNEPGFGHIALSVNDLNQTLQDIERLGGCLQGKVTNFGTEERPILIVYVRDPEGNLIELDQAAHI